MKDDPLVEHYELAKQNLKREKRKEAIIEFRKALEYRPCLGDDKDDWKNYYSVKIQFGDFLRNEGERKDNQTYINRDAIHEANSIFLDVLKDFKSADILDELTQDDQQELEYSLYQNYAKILISFAEEALKINQYEKYREKMTSSHRYFRKSQDIVILRLQRQIEGEGVITQSRWIERYLQLVSNMMQAQIIEGVQFNDQRCLSQILKATDHARQIYEINKNKHKIANQLQSHLHRCYYNKAIVLRLTNKFTESFQLFKKVYEFQKSNSQRNDAQKTRFQLLRFLMNRNKIKEALEFALTNKEKQSILNVKDRRQKFQKVFAAPQHQIKKLTLEDLDQILADFNEEFDQYLYDNQNVDLLLSQNIHLFDGRLPVKAFMYYYLSEANFRMKKYKKSHEMIREAIKISTSDVVDLRDWRIEELKIRVELNCQDPALINLIEQLKGELKTEFSKSDNKELVYALEAQKKEISKLELTLLKKKKKKNDSVIYNILEENDQKLLQKFLKINEKNKESSKIGMSRQIASEKGSYEKSHHQSEERRSINTADMKNKQKMTVLNPEQEYLKFCREKKLVERKEVIKMLSQNTNFNPFAQILNLSAGELEVLLSFVKVSNLDLRNHKIKENDMTLSTILNRVNLPQIKQFKINGANSISHEMLRTLISRMTQLEYLSFVDFTVQKPSAFYQLQNMNIENQSALCESKQPRSVVHILAILTREVENCSWKNLKILKLKYCNLMDDHLPEMRIQCYECLEQLSLSHNLLEGRNFELFMNLKGITKINVSDNPLLSFSFGNWKGKYTDHSVRLKSLKLRNTKLESSLIEQLKSVLLRVVEVDFSECINMGLLIQALGDNWREDKQLVFLERVVLKNIDLEEVNLYLLTHISTGLTNLDVRGCKYSAETKKNLLQNIDQSELQIKISDSDISVQTCSNFAIFLGPT